ncbi:Small nuclear ribonucleoprotein-associated protein B, partial [Coemansia sp. Cherry 401B]
MTLSKNTKMIEQLNHRLRLTLADSRVMVGQMLAFDKHMNLVLADCEEFRTVKTKGEAKGKAKQIKRTLGLVILRGESIVSLSVDAPPPASAASRQAKAALAAGPGVGRPAGRGIPMAPPGMPPPGLAGPVRGMGGAAIAAGPVSFARPPPPMGGPPGAPPHGFRPPMPPPGFRPPMPPPGMGPPGFPPQPPAGFQPPYPRPPQGPP